MRRPALLILPVVVAALGLGWGGAKGLRPSAPSPAASPSSCVAGPPAEESRADAKGNERANGRSLRLPSGVPMGLSCREARRVVAQARFHLATEPQPVDPRALADATVDWLDPHGLWSAAPDAPLATFLPRRARELVAGLEAPGDRGTCRVAG